MLDPIKQLADKMLKLDSNKILKTVLDNKSVQKTTTDLHTIDQMYERSVDSKGNLLKFYAARTIRYKMNIAPKLGRDTRIDHITLKDTGDFYRSFEFKNFIDGFILFADTIKISYGDPYIDKITGKKVTPVYKSDLLRRWPYLLGLDTISKGNLSDEIKPYMVGEVRKKLSGK